MINQRIEESRKALHALPEKKLDKLCQCLITFLGDGVTEAEKDALVALKKGDYDQAKLICLSDPCTPYLAAISCIASAYRSPMVADSVLRDAARHTTEVAKLRTANEIALCFNNILKNPETSE